METTERTKTRRAHTFTCEDCGKADGQPMDRFFDPKSGHWRMAHIRGYGCKKEN